ncbi:hypothetical protein [Halobellus ruber]|uniref:Uncharacterized protein n=1 Tax=Halobellus ruber TaxID=2761102 RepID=A0A7J9SMP4_9EURY|nr:hypothetical protein [Halobellus ruber]MBB6647356.1 hypothetical protein [Halobellus ruber]
MVRDVLLFYHTHTHDSNRFERKIRGVQIESHATDYVRVADRLPAGQDAIFVKTDHWRTDPGYFDRLEARLESRDVALNRFEAHVSFEVTGSRIAVINGLEAAVGRRRHHVTICGVPVNEAVTYTTLDIPSLGDVARDVAWIAPAHVGMPFHRYPTDLVGAVCRMDAEPDIEVALGYATGYVRAYNSIARNEVPFRTTVGEFSEEFGLSLLPELDLHAFVPDGYSGCGIVDRGAIDALCDGRIPVSDLFNADLFRPSDCRRGLTLGQFLRNYAAFLPLFESVTDYDLSFSRSLPDPEWLRDLDIPANTVSLR